MDKRKVRNAVVNICKELNIAGSVLGQYDLYNVVWNEIQKRQKK